MATKSTNLPVGRQGFVLFVTFLPHCIIPLRRLNLLKYPILLSSIKKLAGQTIWYGLSSIFGRFLNYLLTPLLTTIFFTDEYGVISLLFGYAAFLNIFYTYGMETSYFRFASIEPEKKCL